MPRRTYGRGRMRPTANDGDALRKLEGFVARPSIAHLYPGANVAHKPSCDTADVHTFIGIHGDHLARCRRCGRAEVLAKNGATA
ncbi:hypothetical protein [uncultured Nocardioides sp.]|uniref:hypothetical protein n=1 Tax=uncultured Nocardioides sp. TaxID=198441 RepID=UPI0030FC0800